MSKCVLFDLDETLFDRTQTLKRFLATQFLRFQNVLGQSDRETWVKRFIEMDARGKASKRQVYPEILRTFGGDSTQADALIEDYYDNSTRNAIAMTGMRAILDTLETLSVPVGIVTNGETDLQMQTIEALGLVARVQTIVISEAVGFRKPDAEMFLRTARALGVQVSNCIFVGDNPAADILGASSVGMQTAWFNPLQDIWPSHIQTNPGVEICDLEEVATLL